MSPAVQFRFAAIFAAALGLAGCSGIPEVYELKVQSTNNPGSKPVQSYRLQTKGVTMDTNSLRYKEAEERIRAALSGKGMYEAPQPDKADIVIDLDYGISPPLMREETVVTQVTDMNGNLRERYDQVVVTKYEKHVAMNATENNDRPGAAPAATGKPRLLWGIEVTNEDESKDLRKYLPVMIAASIEYIGQETGSVRTIKISENDSAVDFVKRGL